MPLLPMVRPTAWCVLPLAGHNNASQTTLKYISYWFLGRSKGGRGVEEAFNNLASYLSRNAINFKQPCSTLLIIAMVRDGRSHERGFLL